MDKYTYVLCHLSMICTPKPVVHIVPPCAPPWCIVPTARTTEDKNRPYKTLPDAAARSPAGGAAGHQRGRWPWPAHASQPEHMFYTPSVRVRVGV